MTASRVGCNIFLSPQHFDISQPTDIPTALAILSHIYRARVGVDLLHQWHRLLHSLAEGVLESPLQALAYGHRRHPEHLSLVVEPLEGRLQLLLLARLQPFEGGLAPKDLAEPPSEEMSYFSAVCCCDLVSCRKWRSSCHSRRVSGGSRRL